MYIYLLSKYHTVIATATHAFLAADPGIFIERGVQTSVQKGLSCSNFSPKPPPPRTPLPPPPRTSSHHSRLHVIIPWPFTVYLNSTRKRYIIVDQLRTQTETTMSICEHCMVAVGAGNILGSLSIEDGYGSENVTFKMN